MLKIELRLVILAAGKADMSLGHAARAGAVPRWRYGKPGQCLNERPPTNPGPRAELHSGKTQM